LINADPVDQLVFMEALLDVVPESLFIMANNSAEAIELIEERQLKPDCIFVEIGMPQVNGIEFLQRAKRIPLLADVPIIVHAREPTAAIAPLLKTGAYAVYFKPYEYSGIRNVLPLFISDDSRARLN